MTETAVATPSFTIAPAAPVAPAPAAPPAPAGLGGEIRDTWVRVPSKEALDVRKSLDKVARRRALARAREAVESRPVQTKAERLAEQARRSYPGSEQERRLTREAVARAVEKVAPLPDDKTFATDEFRKTCETLRQRYPGRKLSEMLADAQKLEELLMSDPASAFDTLRAAYHRAAPAAEYVEPSHSAGIRGSVQRAHQAQADNEDLQAYIERYGNRLPTILKDLEALDRNLRRDPNFEAARLSARFGAPAVNSEIPAYKERMAVKEAQQRYDRVLKGVDMAIEHKIIDGHEDNLTEIAAILGHPQFVHNPHDGLDTLRRAQAIASHPNHQRLTPKSAKPAKSDAGSKSISGAPSMGAGTKQSTGLRASLAAARRKVGG